MVQPSVEENMDDMKTTENDQETRMRRTAMSR